MKKITLTILVLFVCFLLFGGLGIGFLSVAEKKTVRNTVDERREIEKGEITQLRFETVSEDITIVEEERDTILVQFSGFITSGQNESRAQYITEVNDGELYIAVDEEGFSLQNFFEKSIDIRVAVPKVMLSSLVIETVSGDTDVSVHAIENVSIASVSGDIALKEINVTTLVLETVSGDGDVSFTNTPEISISTVSGDFTVAVPSKEYAVIFDTVSGDFSSETVSLEETGKVTLGSGAHSFSFESVSGDVDVE